MQIHRLMPGASWSFYLLLFTVIRIHDAGGQVAVSALASGPAPSAGEFFDVSIATLADSDFYYAELVVSFDNGVLEFISATTGPLARDGIHLSGELGQGRAGISVSRTAPLGGDASGTFMVLTFRVRENAPGGNTEIVFYDLLILNSAADPVAAGLPPPVILDIETRITGLRLLTAADNTLSEGELFFAAASVFASGVLDNQRIACQVGISPSPSDPESWHEDMWIDMDFDSSDEYDNLRYSAEIAFMRPAGEWFVAVRSALDGGAYVYGGTQGIPDESELQFAVLNIIPRPSFRYSIASWNFDGETLLPSGAAAVNRNASLQIAGATITGFLAGFSGMAVNSNRWSNTDAGPCYWMVEISTTGFVSLEVSSRQYGSGTGPRDFRLEYSIDGFEWNAAAGGEITVGNNWTSGRVDGLPLPAVLEDRERVLLRWIITSDISISGAVTGPTGTNRIDDILISGINPDPLFITVFPGDANNDGVVDADDVLPLGMYWLSTGPAAVWEGNNFSPRSIEQWMPSGATFADTNGDGIVDHRDLLAVGLHFGKSSGTVNKDSTLPLASLTVDPHDGERIKRIMVESVPLTSLRGVAFSIEINGIPGDMWEIGNVVPAFSGGHAGNELISFALTGDNVFEAAFAFKGQGDDLVASSLAGFELVIDEGWNEEFTVILNRLSVSNSGSPGTRVGEGRLVLTESLVPVSVVLPERSAGLHLQVSPNPFSDISVISFDLDVPSVVRLDICCTRGSIVATPLNGFRSQGSHSIFFEGGFLPPGIYLCRLITPEGYRVVRMVRLP
jgi:hypothetical protein